MREIDRTVEEVKPVMFDQTKYMAFQRTKGHQDDGLGFSPPKLRERLEFRSTEKIKA